MTTESPPRWIEPEHEGESRLALDLIPAASSNSRLWVFLHGLSSSRRGDKALYFARQIARRGEAFASLDMTGHGDSEGDLFGLSLSRNLRDVERGIVYLEEQLGSLQTIHLVGSSMGGLAALWYSARHPGRIGRNIVIAPAFEMAGRMLLGLGRERARSWRQSGRTKIRAGATEFELSYDFVEDETRYPTVGLMKRLTTPTLIVHGSDDEVVPCQLSRQFSERTAGVDLHVVDGGDHRLTSEKETLFDLMWRFAG